MSPNTLLLRAAAWPSSGSDRLDRENLCTEGFKSATDSQQVLGVNHELVSAL